MVARDAYRAAGRAKSLTAAGVLLSAGACFDLDPAMPSLSSSMAGDGIGMPRMDSRALPPLPQIDPSPASSSGNPAVPQPGMDWRDAGGDAARVERGTGTKADASAGGAEEHLAMAASLDIQDQDLVVSLHNYTGLPATVLLSAHIDNPEGTYVNLDVAKVIVAAADDWQVILPASELDGFDVAGRDWSRTLLRYEFTLQDGRSGTQTTELAIRAGQVVPRDEAIATGRQLPDMVLDADALTDVTADPELKEATFKACFRNVIDLLPQLVENVPTACPFEVDDPTAGGCVNGLDHLVQNRQVLPMPGQMFSYVAPNGATGTGSVDATGCTPPLLRQPGPWQFKLYLSACRASPARAVYFLADDGSLILKDELVEVGSTGNPTTVDVQVTGSYRNFQAAVFLVNNTLERVNGIHALPPHGIVRVSPWPTSGVAFYCHATAAGCATPRTLRVHPEIAHERGLIAHETGRFIHAQNLDCPSCSPASALFANDYSYSDANAGNPSDNCRRTEIGHDYDTIEWQSAAHLEGLATFFAAVTYNEYTGTDKSCQLPQYVGGASQLRLLDCEAPGQTPSPCVEWAVLALFDKTGNELDWTKMYWDFLTDYEDTNFATYMQAERNVGAAWPLDAHGNHFDLIWPELEALERTRGDTFFNSSFGNILAGPVR